MDNQKQKKKKSVMDTLSATMVLVLIALLLVFVGYTYLALKNGYTLDDLIDNIVGNLIGIFCLAIRPCIAWIVSRSSGISGNTLVSFPLP